MTLADPAGGTLRGAARPAPAFTPAEYARAQALVEVSGALVRRHAEQTTLLLPDGAELLIRAGRPATTSRASAGCTHAARRPPGSGAIRAARRCPPRPGCAGCWSRPAG